MAASAASSGARQVGDGLPYVFVTWPANYQDYGPVDSATSFRSCSALATELGCTIQLRGRRTAKRQSRAVASLKIRGQRANEVFDDFWERSLHAFATVNPGIADLVRRLRPPLVVEEDVVDEPPEEERRQRVEVEVLSDDEVSDAEAAPTPAQEAPMINNCFDLGEYSVCHVTFTCFMNAGDGGGGGRRPHESHISTDSPLTSHQEP